MSYNGLTDACRPIMFYRPDKEKNGITSCHLEDRLLLLLLLVLICFVVSISCICQDKISPHGQRLDFVAKALMTKQEKKCFLDAFK